MLEEKTFWLTILSVSTDRDVLRKMRYDHAKTDDRARSFGFGFIRLKESNEK